MIEEKVEDATESVDTDHKIVTASPARGLADAREQSRKERESYHPGPVFKMNALDTAGPRPLMGTVQIYSHALVANRYFMGTNSLDTNENDNCVEAASPIKVVAPIRVGID